MSTYLTLGTHESLGFEVHFEDLASFSDIFQTIIANSLPAHTIESWLHRLNPWLKIWIFKLVKWDLSMYDKLNHTLAAKLRVKYKVLYRFFKVATNLFLSASPIAWQWWEIWVLRLLVPDLVLKRIWQYLHTALKPSSASTKFCSKYSQTLDLLTRVWVEWESSELSDVFADMLRKQAKQQATWVTTTYKKEGSNQSSRFKLCNQCDLLHLLFIGYPIH